jgi:hypothetical protein
MDLLLSHDKYLARQKLKKNIQEVSLIEISNSSVQRVPKKLGYSNILPKHRIEFSTKLVEKRIKRGRAYIGENLDGTVISDEFMFQPNSNCRSLWTRAPRNGFHKTSQFPKNSWSEVISTIRTYIT